MTRFVITREGNLLYLKDGATEKKHLIADVTDTRWEEGLLVNIIPHLDNEDEGKEYWLKSLAGVLEQVALIVGSK
jgi:hypothetical protein